MDPSQVIIEVLGGVLVGLSLGLVGAGGAIFSVPIFAMVLGHGTQTAIFEALAVTGFVACVSAFRAACARRVDFQAALSFMLPGMAGAWLGGPVGKWLPDAVQAGIFSVVALFAATRMLSTLDRAEPVRAGSPSLQRIAAIAATGFSIGILTSVIGVGGGFLLVPAFVLIVGLDMPRAVGTSLVLIATNAGVALASNAAHSPDLLRNASWSAIGIVAVCGVGGSLVGARVGSRIPQRRLKQVFAGLLACVSILFALEGAGITHLQGRGANRDGVASEVEPGAANGAASATESHART